MAHADKIKFRAFYLFLVGEAGSFEEIARKIREEYGTKTSGVTIARWADEPDENGMTWSDRKAALAVQLRKDAEADAQDRMAARLAEASTVADVLYKQIVDADAPKIKDLPSAVYALRHMREFEMLLEERRNGHMSPIAVVTMLLQTFQEIPEIARPLRTHWDRVMSTVRTRLLEAPHGEEA